MDVHAEKALQYFQQGANCCQAVTLAYNGEFGLDESVASRIGAAFGGGMRRGEVCGAVVGALMILGLRFGAVTPENQAQKAVANAKTAAFMKRFAEAHGTYLCRELLKTNNGKICDTAITDAIMLLERICGE